MRWGFLPRWYKTTNGGDSWERVLNHRSEGRDIGVVDVVMDPNQAIARDYQVNGIPHTVIIDKEGNIQWVHVGFSSDAATHLQEAIEDLLFQLGGDAD